jgi:hypothetical protein
MRSREEEREVSRVEEEDIRVECTAPKGSTMELEREGEGLVMADR